MTSQPRPDQVENAYLSLANPATPALELGRTVHFIERANSSFVKRRSDLMFTSAIENLMAFRLQSRPNLLRSDSLEILAQTLVYERESGRLMEFGTIGVEEDHQGFGAMFRLGQLAITHVCELGYDLACEADHRMIAVVAYDNPFSEANCRKLGFHDAPDDHPGWAAIGETPDSFRDLEKRLLALSPGAVKAAYEGMRAFAAKPVLTNRAGQSIRVEFGPRAEIYSRPAYYDFIADRFSPSP